MNVTSSPDLNDAAASFSEKPVDCRNRSAIYVSTRTKHKVSEILHLLGNESTRLTALVDNMLRFVMDIYSGELNYLHEKKNNRRPF